MAKLVANSYGNALFELALEKNNLDDMLEEITCLQKIFQENADFRKFLSHPQISKEEKISVIENTFKGKADNDIVGLLVLIVKKDRYNEIDAIFNYFISRVKEYKHIGIASVTSAKELTDEQKAQARNNIEVPTALKNPSALTIKVGNTTISYDGSEAKTVEIADGSEVAY